MQTLMSTQFGIYIENELTSNNSCSTFHHNYVKVKFKVTGNWWLQIYYT